MFHLLQSEVQKDHSLQRSTNETLILNWYLDIDLNLEVCVIVFKKLEQEPDFFKAVPSKYNSVNMLYSLTYKV